MTGMDDLVQWLRAQFDEEAALAKAASPGPWYADEESDQVLAVDGIAVADGFALSGRQLRATVEHIVRHDPARVLREIDAKRQIVTLMAGMLNAAEGDSEVDHYGGLGAAEDTLELLALPYVDRPGYREDWRP